MFFNRLKIFLTLLIVLSLSLLFWQNQESLALKLLCPDVNQSCLYQTPQLPLSLWMAIFILAGMITSLIWQSLNYLSTKGANKPKSSASTPYFSESEKTPRNPQPETKSTNTRSTKRGSVKTHTTVEPPIATNVSPKSDWEDNSNSDDWTKEDSTQNKVVDRSNPRQTKDTSSNPSPNTTYSYKSRPDDPSEEPKVDRVYDANYRVINPSLRKSRDSGETRQDDGDEEWI